MTELFPLRPDYDWYDAMIARYGGAIPAIEHFQIRPGLQTIVGDFFTQLHDHDLLRRVDIHSIITRNACFVIIDASGHFGLPIGDYGAVDALISETQTRLSESCEHCASPAKSSRRPEWRRYSMIPMPFSATAFSASNAMNLGAITMTERMPIGWLDLVTDMRLDLTRDFPTVTVVEMTADRGWLYVRVDDRGMDPAARLRLDRVVQGYVTQSLTTCMCCSSHRGRDRGDRLQIICDECEEVSCDA